MGRMYTLRIKTELGYGGVTEYWLSGRPGHDRWVESPWDRDYYDKADADLMKERWRSWEPRIENTDG